LQAAKTFTFKVNAINQAGISLDSNTVSAETLAKPASEPTHLVATNITINELELSWLEPADDGGAEITDYVVEMSADGGISWQVIPRPVSSLTTLKVVGLRPSNFYLFRVFAVNHAGFSVYSNSLGAATLATTPQAPTNLKTKIVTPTTITLSWLAPEDDGGSLITDYVVEQLVQGEWIALDPGSIQANSVLVSKLTPSSEYSFRVTARNSVGLGVTSDTYTFSTISSRAPKAPTTVSFANVTTSSATILWSPVSADSPVTSYTIEYSLLGSSWKTATKEASLRNTISISGLTPGSLYEVRISATNSDGQGGYLYSTFKTAAAAPKAPTRLFLSKVHSSGFTLNWSAPTSDGGSQVTGYMVQIYGGGNLWTELDPVDSSGASLEITGLKPGVKYSVRMFAVNQVGRSANSRTLNLKTQAVLPSTPTGLVLKTASKTKAIITWDSVNNGGAPILDYFVEYSSDQGKTWFDSQRAPVAATYITLKSLKSGTQYLVRITAKNKVGASSSSQYLEFTTL
jgi:titin